MGVALLACALLAQAPVPGAPVVRSVEIHLPQGSDRALLEGVSALLGLRPAQTLSLRAARRTVQRLMETGRFADVVVRVVEVDGGVEVVVELMPRQQIGSLYVEGNRVLSRAEVLAASKLQPETEYFPERVQGAVEGVLSAYRVRGYLDASVDVLATQGEQGVDVGFVVREGEPTRLEQLTFSGEVGLPVARLRATLGVEVGDVLDLGLLEAGVERLRKVLRAERFYRARVDAPLVLPRGGVVVPIAAGPRFELRIRGNQAFPDGLLRGVLGWDGAEPLDPATADRLAHRLLDFLRYRGFHDARVRPVERRSPEGRHAVLTFEVDEGPQRLVQRVDFQGNHSVASKELRAVLADVVAASAPQSAEEQRLDDPQDLEGRSGKIHWGDVPLPRPEAVFVEEAWLDAARSMEVLYRDRGFLQARVRLERVDFGPRAATARFQVDEGPQAVFEATTVRGWPGEPPAELEGVEVGGPFSERRVDGARQQLLRELARLGHLYGVVEPAWSVDDAARVQLVLKVSAGPQVKVGNVIVRGLARTAEPVVREQLEVRSGDALDPGRLYTSQKNLLALGIFRTADVRILSPEVREPVKDVLVEVRESARLSGEFGLGYFLAEGPRIMVDAAYPNAGGRAVNISGRLRVFYFAASGLALSRQVDTSDLSGFELFGGRGNISVQNRGLLPANIGLRLDLVGERVFRQTYRFTRFAIVPGLDWSTNLKVPFWSWTRPKLSLAFQSETEVSLVAAARSVSGATDPLQYSDQQRLRFLFGTFALTTLRLLPTLDLRDDPVVPRKGLLMQVEAEGTLDLYTQDTGGAYVPVKFIKLATTLTGYVPVSQAVVLALSARGGRIFPLTPGSVTPPVKRFFLGGASSMRGFREDGLLAEDQRADIAQQVTDCRALANPVGCTEVAKSIAAGREIGSQGGELFLLGKAELRFPAATSIDLGVFFEAGNLWLGPPRAFALRTVAGAGVRYMTPIGPLAFDLGVNLAPDRWVNEPAINLHFNIGYF